MRFSFDSKSEPGEAASAGILLFADSKEPLTDDQLSNGEKRRRRPPDLLAHRKKRKKEKKKVTH